VWSNSKKDKTLTMNQIKHYLSMAKQVMQYWRNRQICLETRGDL
jgi:hypothetical protein